MDPLLTVTDFTNFADQHFREKYLNPDGSWNLVDYPELNWFAKQIALRMGEAKDAASSAQSLAAALTTSWATLPSRYQSLTTTIYVNPTSGNDTTGTGASGSPVATYARAAALAGTLFHRVTVYQVGNCTLSADVTFFVPELTIVLQGNTLTVAKRQNIMDGATNIGDGNYSITNYGNITLTGTISGAGPGTLTIEAHNGAGSGGATATWRSYQGAFRLGNVGWDGDARKIKLTRLTVTVGAKATLAAPSQFGTSVGNRFDSHFEHDGCTFTIGTGARLAHYFRTTSYQKAILFNDTNSANASAWQTLFQAVDEVLQTGTYAVRLELSTNTNGGSMYEAGFSGIMSWRHEQTNAADEVRVVNTMHGMGLNLAAKNMGMRVAMVYASTSPANAAHSLQLFHDQVLTSAATVMARFTRLL